MEKDLIDLTVVPRLRKLSYDEFSQQFLIPLRPCILTDLMDGWPAYRNWCARTEERIFPAYAHLRKSFGGDTVAVHTTSRGRDGHTERIEMVFDDFLKRLELNPSLPLYAKDIHLARTHNMSKLYHVPDLFVDDWLNYYCTKFTDDDYRFLYIGGDGTRTALHRDVVSSHSWSSSFAGIKEWILIPPDHAPALFDRSGEVPDHLFDSETPISRYPNIEQARDNAVIVYQQPGETIFVPSGWFHEVKNIGPTLSINHNWCNLSSLNSMYERLREELHLSRMAVIDLLQDGVTDERTFAEIVQNLCQQNSGWSWLDFFSIILCRVQMHKGLDNSLWPVIAEHLRPSYSQERNQILSICARWDREEPDRPHLGKVTNIVKKITDQLGHL